MAWTGLLLFQGAADAPAGWTFLYGCLAAARALPPAPASATAALATVAGDPVVQIRVGVDDALAGAVTGALRAGTLDFAPFVNSAAVTAQPVAVGRPRHILQPEPVIARRWVADERLFGVPPGFITAPTRVVCFRALAPWQPPAVDPSVLVARPSGSNPNEPGDDLLRNMTELSGLPFNKAYAERLRCFEVMTAIAPHA
jgi:hypothetical protein